MAAGGRPLIGKVTSVRNTRTCVRESAVCAAQHTRQPKPPAQLSARFNRQRGLLTYPPFVRSHGQAFLFSKSPSLITSLHPQHEYQTAAGASHPLQTAQDESRLLQITWLPQLRMTPPVRPYQAKRKLNVSSAFVVRCALYSPFYSLKHNSADSKIQGDARGLPERDERLK